MWEAKVIATAAAETNWKHKVTPEWGDLKSEGPINLTNHWRKRRKRVISTEELQFNHKPAKMLLTEKRRESAKMAKPQA